MQLDIAILITATHRPQFPSAKLRSDSDLRNQVANLHIRHHFRPRKGGRKSTHSVRVFVLRIEVGFRPQKPIRYWNHFQFFSSVGCQSAAQSSDSEAITKAGLGKVMVGRDLLCLRVNAQRRCPNCGDRTGDGHHAAPPGLATYLRFVVRFL
jgi:hypothetical protein